MTNQKKPKKLTFKDTAKLIEKGAKAMTEGTKKAAELSAEALKRLKDNREDASERTGESLEIIDEEEAKAMEKTDKLYKRKNPYVEAGTTLLKNLETNPRKNPYVEGATGTLAHLTNKKSLKDTFPEKPITIKRKPTRPPSEPEIKLTPNPETAPGPFDAAKMLEKAYEKLDDQLVKKYYDKGLNAPAVGIAILRAKKDSILFGEMNGSKPRKEVEALIQEWVGKKRNEILNNKENWKQ